MYSQSNTNNNSDDTSVLNILPDTDPALSEADGFEGLTNPDDVDTPRPSWVNTADDLEKSLVAHICREDSVLAVAKELLDPGAFVNNLHKRLVTLAYDYFESSGSAPKPAFLKAMFVRDLREACSKLPEDKRKKKEFAETILATEILGVVDVASNSFWVETIYQKQQKFILMKATDAFLKGDRAKYWELSDQARKIVPETEPLWDYATAVYEPAEQLIDGLISSKDLVLLYGPSGSYKSFVALDWCLSIATGLPWQGRETTKGRVLYVCAESGESLKKRVDAWAQANKVPAEDISEGFRAITHEMKIDDPAQFQSLLKRVEEWKPSKVFFDTLDRCMLGSESKTEDMKKAVDAAIRLRNEGGVGVCLVHHTGKDVTRGSKGDNRLPNACDVVVSVLRNSGNVTRLHVEKLKEDERPADMFLRPVRHHLGYVNRKGIEETSLTLTAATEAEYTAKAPDSITAEERLALNLIPSLNSDGLTDELVKLHGLTQGELADQIGIDKRTASKFFANLEKAGLIARRPIGKFKYVWRPELKSSV